MAEQTSNRESRAYELYSGAIVGGELEFIMDFNGLPRAPRDDRGEGEQTNGCLPDLSLG